MFKAHSCTQPGQHECWKEIQISLASPVLFFAHTHKLQLIYFESTDRTIAEGTFILDRAVCLLDIVDGRQSTDVSGLQSLAS